MKRNSERPDRSQTRTLAQKIARYRETGDCDQCGQLSWRRDFPLCLVCGKPYADEDLTECRREAVTRRYHREVV